MPVARSSRELFDYVAEEDRKLPKEKQTVFHLRRFSARLAARTQDLAEGKKGQLLELLLRFGIAGWTNFCDAAGEMVPCEHEKGVHLLFGCEVDQPLTVDSLNRLSQALLGELATAIFQGNTLSEEDAKN
jgi:hypothetical protein